MIYMTKAINILVFTLLLESCSSLGITRSASYLEGYIRGFDEDLISQDYYQSNEYSFANVKIGKGPAAVIVLAFAKNGLFEWRGGDGVVIFTRNGQIVKTVGLPSDVSFQAISISDNSDELTYTTSTFSNPSLLRANTLNQSIALNETFTIDRVDGTHLTNVFKLKRTIPSIQWTGTSRYYVDFKDRVIYSEEEIHPFLPTIRIDYFYKY